MKANGTSTLIAGRKNVIVDTLSPWDKNVIVAALSQRQLTCEDVDYVVCTHGHVDHIGNLNLFTNASHIVGFSISKEDSYYIHPFEAVITYLIRDASVPIALVTFESWANIGCQTAFAQN